MDVFFDEQIFVAQEHGGISRYFTELALELGRTGDVHAHVFGGITRNGYIPALRGAPGVTAQYLRRRDRLRINTTVARLSRWWARRAFAKLRRHSRALVYHATNYSLDGWMAARADAVCVTVFDLIGEQFGDPERRARSLEQKGRAVTAAHMVLCISEQTQRDLASLLPECRERTAVTLLAASLPRAKSDEQDSAAQFAPYFLMVGKRHGYKNGTVALQAFSKVARKHSRLRLVCFGGEALKADEEDVLSEVSARVVTVSGSDGLLAAFYANAVALLYPSRYEGFGLPVLEAMQSGCPVLTTRCASLPEVAGTAAVYIEPDDLNGWTREADRLLRDPDSRLSLIAQGRAQAGQFSWKSTARQTRAAYERALARKLTEAGSLPPENKR